MSNSESAEPQEVRPIQSDIEQVYRQYQQAHLYEELDEVAGEMERQLLQKSIANKLLNTEIEIDSDAKEAVEAAHKELGTDDLDQLEALIEDAKEKVHSERTRINNQIQGNRVELHNTVEALTKLNSEIGFMDAEELESLENLLDNWNWEAELSWEDTESIDERLDEASAFATRKRSIFEEASSAVGRKFEGSEIQTLITSLLSGGGISLTELEQDQWEALAESELADHIELSLG